jgi:hypothetical protein
MMKTQTENKKKRAYEKPSIRIISITDSIQVLGIGCKSNIPRAQPGPTANPCVPGIRCNQQGS